MKLTETKKYLICIQALNESSSFTSDNINKNSSSSHLLLGIIQEFKSLLRIIAFWCLMLFHFEELKGFYVSQVFFLTNVLLEFSYFILKCTLEFHKMYNLKKFLII